MPHSRLAEMSGNHDLPVQRAAVLAWMFGVSSVLCVVAMLIGRSPGNSRAFVVGATVVGAVVAGALWLYRRRRWEPRLLQGLLMLYSLIVALLAGTADSVNAVTSLGPAVIITCAYAGCFYSRHLLWIQVGVSVGSYIAAAFLSAPPTAWAALLTAISAAIAMAALLNELTAVLRRRSLHDGLTGAVNRTTWMKITTEKLHQVGRRPVTIAMIDLDRFKQINDSFGHEAGDQLLHDVCRSWEQALGGRGLIGRYGGDEFVVLFHDVERHRAELLLQTMRESHHAPWTTGVAVAGENDDLPTLLRRADTQLRKNKQRSRSATLQPDDGHHRDEATPGAVRETSPLSKESG